MNQRQFLEFFLLAPAQSRDKGRVGWWPQMGAEGQVIRQGLKHPEKDAERVSGHTAGVATLVMLCMSVPELSNGLDMMRAMQMALLHDMLGEWRVGDTNGHHTEHNPARIESILRKKKLDERNAAEEACAPLPNPLWKYYLNIWIEYCKGTSAEARLVKQLDKIDFLLMGLYYFELGESIPFKEEFFPNVRRKITLPWLQGLVDEVEHRF